MAKSALLLLQDGTVWHGKAAGTVGTCTGEACFNTGMTGYQEIFTDPSYFGQILISTEVHIGNYGIKASEAESHRVQISGLVCKDFNVPQFRTMSDYNIQEYFERENIVAIQGVDTRALVQHIRRSGAQNCIISSEISDVDELALLLAKVPSMHGLELSSKVSTVEPYLFGDAATATHTVAVLDYGVKRSILKCMTDRGLLLNVFPYNTPFEMLEQFAPDAYFLSNGPGDPASMPNEVQTVKQILELDKPLFGICLGQQLLAAAVGLPTYKLHHGHRGLNHPVKNLQTGLCEITSQNHGFGVLESAVHDSPSLVSATHINLNDQTVEGLKIKGKPAFSVQYHPEASPGPHDARYLFDEFVGYFKN